MSLQILQSVLHKCQQIMAICEKSEINRNVANELGNRVKTCFAMIESVIFREMNCKQAKACLRLLESLNEFEQALPGIIGKDILLNFWHTNSHKFSIPIILDQITGALIELDVPCLIYINADSNKIQQKINEILENLKIILREISNPSDILKPNIIESLCEVLDCKEKVIYESVEYIKNEIYVGEVFFNQDSKIIDSNINEIEVNYEALMFWNKYFYHRMYTFWFYFSECFYQEYLVKVPNDKYQAILEKIRQELDPNNSGIITLKQFNVFYVGNWKKNNNLLGSLDQVTFSPNLLSLSLTITSSITSPMLIGKKYLIRPSSNFSHFSNKNFFFIGRDRHHCNLEINESSISAVHSLIYFHPDSQFTYTDLGSSAGTYLLIDEPLLLYEGVLIQIASSHILHVKKLVFNSKKYQIKISGLNNSSQEASNEMPLTTMSKKFSENETINEISAEQEESRFDFRINPLKEGPNLIKNIEEHSQNFEKSFDSQTSAEIIDGIEPISEIEIEFILKGCNKGRAFRFTSAYENISIGRDEESTIFINDPFVSTLHGIINLTEKGWVYTDCISSNKSWRGLSDFDQFSQKLLSKTIKLGNGLQIKIANIDFLIETFEINLTY